MPKPFDTTTKHLIEMDPTSWLDFLALPHVGTAEVIEADLASVIAEADKVIRVNDPEPWLVEIEAQASYDRSILRRILEYSVLLSGRYDLPVLSVLLLLRPEADEPDLTGVYERRLPNGDRYHEFRYRVVRLWQQPVELFLTGGIGILPLAPVANVTPDSLPGVIRRMNERLARDASPSEAATLWTATYFLMGLRYSADLTQQLLRGVLGMKESSTYQAVLAEGKSVGLAEGKSVGLAEGKSVGLAEGKSVGLAEGTVAGRAGEARQLLLRLGTKRFGPPDARTRAAIEAVTETPRLEELADRLLDVSSWAALFAAPAGPTD